MRTAPRVLTHATDLDRLRAFIAALDDGHAVAVHVDDGTELHGLVAERPTLQQFFDAQGNEGSNALLRLEATGDAGAAWLDVWLDRVSAVRELDPAERTRLAHGAGPAPRSAGAPTAAP